MRMVFKFYSQLKTIYASRFVSSPSRLAQDTLQLSKCFPDQRRQQEFAGGGQEPYSGYGTRSENERE